MIVKNLKRALVCLVTCFALNASGQDTSSARKVLVIAELGAHGIGLAAEWNHPGIFTVETGVTYGPSYDVDDYFFANLTIPSYSRPAVRFSVNPRFYITRQRESQGAAKNRHQIEQYFGLIFAYVTESFDSYYPSTTLSNIHYGIRQPVSNKLIFTAYGGVGWARNNETSLTTFYPAFNVKIGFTFN